jgi:hypothetical protein
MNAKDGCAFQQRPAIHEYPAILLVGGWRALGQSDDVVSRISTAKARSAPRRPL